ncbi:bleomycin resistance protein [Rhizobium sp. TRM95796]|uniref:bleomycin resistance protein n=1 Tax=Rhizobium sp. TRM95796 TaxID=2979862 RepID=UPI0021E70E42|nr:VOC family protein [Rhizobium sp. TRM95796]MCV3766088.1 VOC family protein [Rhizobium sp. TRM95796]
MPEVIEDADVIDVLPVLPSLSIAQTRDFYRDKLGFNEIVHEADDYLIVRRVFAGRRMELHFWLTDDRRLPELSSVYLRGGGIVALHAEYSTRDLPDLSPLQIRPWGMQEFYIRDPHGNLLRFGSVV